MALGRGVELHGDADQPERHGALPDRAHLTFPSAGWPDRLDHVAGPESAYRSGWPHASDARHPWPTTSPPGRSGPTRSSGTACGCSSDVTATGCGSPVPQRERRDRHLPRAARPGGLAATSCSTARSSRSPTASRRSARSRTGCTCATPRRARRLAEHQPGDLMVFDVLRLDGEDLSRPAAVAERASCCRASASPTSPGRCPPTYDDGAMLLEATRGAGPRGHRQQAAVLALPPRPAQPGLAEVPAPAHRRPTWSAAGAPRPARTSRLGAVLVGEPTADGLRLPRPGRQRHRGQGRDRGCASCSSRSRRGRLAVRRRGARGRRAGHALGGAGAGGRRGGPRPVVPAAPAPAVVPGRAGRPLGGRPAVNTEFTAKVSSCRGARAGASATMRLAVPPRRPISREKSCLVLHARRSRSPSPSSPAPSPGSRRCRAPAPPSPTRRPAPPPAPGVQGQLNVYWFDVDQGDRQLLVGPTGRTMLIDLGETAFNSKGTSTNATAVAAQIRSICGTGTQPGAPRLRDGLAPAPRPHRVRRQPRRHHGVRQRALPAAHPDVGRWPRLHRRPGSSTTTAAPGPTPTATAGATPAPRPPPHPRSPGTTSAPRA